MTDARVQSLLMQAAQSAAEADGVMKPLKQEAVTPPNGSKNSININITNKSRINKNGNNGNINGSKNSNGTNKTPAMVMATAQAHLAVQRQQQQQQQQQQVQQQRKSSGGSSKKKGQQLRRGKWTPEEEAYANRLIQEFKAGLLPLTDGTTLRTFLSKLLNCDPMRISKKFVGSNCIGKQVFRRRTADLNRLTPEQIQKSRAELSDLERRFLERVAQTNRVKNSSTVGGGSNNGHSNNNHHAHAHHHHQNTHLHNQQLHNQHRHHQQMVAGAAAAAGGSVNPSHHNAVVSAALSAAVAANGGAGAHHRGINGPNGFHLNGRPGSFGQHAHHAAAAAAAAAVSNPPWMQPPLGYKQGFGEQMARENLAPGQSSNSRTAAAGRALLEGLGGMGGGNSSSNNSTTTKGDSNVTVNMGGLHSAHAHPHTHTHTHTHTRTGSNAESNNNSGNTNNFVVAVHATTTTTRSNFNSNYLCVSFVGSDGGGNTNGNGGGTIANKRQRWRGPFSRQVATTTTTAAPIGVSHRSQSCSMAIPRSLALLSSLSLSHSSLSLSLSHSSPSPSKNGDRGTYSRNGSDQDCDCGGDDDDDDTRATMFEDNDTNDGTVNVNGNYPKASTSTSTQTIATTIHGCVNPTGQQHGYGHGYAYGCDCKYDYGNLTKATENAVVAAVYSDPMFGNPLRRNYNYIDQGFSGATTATNPTTIATTTENGCFRCLNDDDDNKMDSNPTVCAAAATDTAATRFNGWNSPSPSLSLPLAAFDATSVWPLSVSLSSLLLLLWIRRGGVPLLLLLVVLSLSVPVLLFRKRWDEDINSRLQWRSRSRYQQTFVPGRRSPFQALHAWWLRLRWIRSSRSSSSIGKRQGNHRQTIAQQLRRQKRQTRTGTNGGTKRHLALLLACILGGMGGLRPVNMNMNMNTALDGASNSGPATSVASTHNGAFLYHERVVHSAHHETVASFASSLREGEEDNDDDDDDDDNDSNKNNKDGRRRVRFAPGMHVVRTVHPFHRYARTWAAQAKQNNTPRNEPQRVEWVSQ